MSYGLACVRCGSDATEVKDTRPVVDGIRRYRQCRCGHRFKTMEVIVRTGRVAGKNKQRPFKLDRTKLLRMRREGGTYKQIAAALGVSISLVWQRVNRVETDRL